MPGICQAQQLDSSTARQLDSSTARQLDRTRHGGHGPVDAPAPIDRWSQPRALDKPRQARQELDRQGLDTRQPLDSSLDSASTEPRQLDSSTAPVGSTLNVSGRRASLDHQHHRVRMSYTLHGRRWARPSCTLGANARSPSPRHRT